MDPNDLTRLKRTDLQKICKELKLKATGKNSDLLSRLEEHFKGKKDVLPLIEEEEADAEQVADKNTALKDETASSNNLEKNPPKEKKGKGKSKANKSQSKKAKGTSKKKKKEKDSGDKNLDNPITDGITDEKFIAYVNAPSDEEPRASSSSQESSYCLPSVGKDSVFIPGKLAETFSTVEASILGPSCQMTPVTAVGVNSEQSKLVAKISPLMTSTIERVATKPSASSEEPGDENDESLVYNGSYAEYADCNNTTLQSNFNTTIDAIANQREQYDLNSDFETADSPCPVPLTNETISFSTPTNLNNTDFDATGNASQWLKSCREDEGEKRTIERGTFLANQSSDFQSILTNNQSTKRETFCDQSADFQSILTNNQSTRRETFCDQSADFQSILTNNQSSRRETFCDQSADFQGIVQNNQSTRRETYCINKDHELATTHAQRKERRGTFLITGESPMNPRNQTTRVGSYEDSGPAGCSPDPVASERGNGTFDMDQSNAEKEPGIASSAYVPNCDATANGRLKNHRQTFVLKRQQTVKSIDNAGQDGDEDSSICETSAQESGAFVSNQAAKNGEKTSVNFCGCHGEIKRSADWRRLSLIGCLVFVESITGQLSRFLLTPEGKATPIGYKDNMICGDCVRRNIDELKRRKTSQSDLEKFLSKNTKTKMKPSTSKSNLPQPVSKGEVQSSVLQGPQNRCKRKWDNNDKENISSPFKRRRSEIIVDGSKARSPASPQVRRARGEKLELAKKLLEPWKPRKNSIDPAERREDFAYAKKVEEILRSVEPGSEEEMALIMNKMPKLSKN